MLIFVLLQIFAVVHAKGISPKSVHLQYNDNGVLKHNEALTQHEKVKLQFYYETECPYSVNAYVAQLEDVVKELGPYLDITTYPYGNAHMNLNGTELTIKCQHKNTECYGNMLHACAIEALKEATKYVPFNACMMGYTVLDGNSNDESADKCGQKLNVDVKPIKECAKGIRGFQLLLHYGIESGKVKYRGVPWWYVNGVSKISGEKKPLKKILCDAFKNPPEVCIKKYLIF